MNKLWLPTPVVVPQPTGANLCMYIPIKLHVIALKTTLAEY